MSSGRNRYSSAPMDSSSKVNMLLKHKNNKQQAPAAENNVPVSPSSYAPSSVSDFAQPVNQTVFQPSVSSTDYVEPAYRQQNTFANNQFQNTEASVNGNTAQAKQHKNAKRKKPSQIIWLQAALTFAVPLLFVLSLIMADQYLLGLAFIGIAVILVALMWILKAFTANARKTLTTIYIALIIVAGVCTYMHAVSPATDNNTNNNTGIFAQNSPSANPVSTSSAVSADTTPPIIVSSGNAAKQQLETFIGYWMLTQYENCLYLCRPEWVNNQANAKVTLFNKLGDFKPISYTIENIEGSETDSSRTVKVLILGNNMQNQEVYYRYTVLMLKINNTWYVDPDSLNGIIITNEDLAKTGISVTTPKPTPSPKPTTDPNTTLYYNPDGGVYYHITKKCSSMNTTNQKKLQPFSYLQVNNDPYKNLSPCPKCGAPQR